MATENNMKLTRRQSEVFKDIKNTADEFGEAPIQKFARWNPRTLTALEKKGLIHFVGETASLASHPEQQKSKAFAVNELNKKINL